MKPSRAPSGKGRQRQRGMTLPEIMVTAAIFFVVLAGILTIHLAGLRMNEFARSKMGASDEARAAISRMIGEIRGAGAIRIGNGDETAFVEVAHGEAQVGNAIEVYATKGVTNDWVRYFWDLDDRRLKRTENGSPAVLVVASSIRNEQVFTSEDFQGNILTNNHNNRVIGVSLEFFQLQNPTVPIGPGSLFDYYQLRTKITRRAIE